MPPRYLLDCGLAVVDIVPIESTQVRAKVIKLIVCLETVSLIRKAYAMVNDNSYHKCLIRIVPNYS